jgi:prepilin-type N-terminal cleavage/methylation domain-containing protein
MARGFTLVELVVAIAIVIILVSLLLPAISMVRDSVRRAKTVGLIDGLTAALEIYALEDGRRRFPAVEADQSLRTSSNTGGAPRTLDLLRDRGSLWRNDDLEAGGDRLVDAWRRPVHYVVDDLIDKVIARPALHRTDWNPKAREPFGYVWSLGRPSGNDAADADPTDASRWLYHGASK